MNSNFELAYRKGEIVTFVGTKTTPRQVTVIIETGIIPHLPYLVELKYGGETHRHHLEQGVLERGAKL